MKPAELFPGAVVVYGKGLFVATFSSKRWIRLGKLKVRPDDPLLQPLPISPAVLAGLGFQKDGNDYIKDRIKVQKEDGWWTLFSNYTFGYAHALQGACIHLYGVELVWNQEEYEQALKEETE